MLKYEEFKNNIFKKTGIDLSLYKERQMKRRIESLVNRNKLDNFDDYYKLLCKDKEKFDQFINYLTINVSEFYRNPEQWEILKTDIIPYLLENNKHLKVWSAACSTGEEPYTLIMTLSNFFSLNQIKIEAYDIDEEALAKAKYGKYTEKSITNVPDEFKERYFRLSDDGYYISDDIKKCANFKKINLLSDSYPTNFDLIVCRNVMIYFTDEAKDEMYMKFSNSLKKGGILFVGSTEQIISPQRYNLKSRGTFFYERV